MNYDFDMHSILPLAAQREARLAGREGDLSGQQIALFRDPRVIEALRRADPGVQQLFLEAGFGLTSWISRVPEGTFRDSDGAARSRVITRFAAKLRQSSDELREADWGGFELSAFTESYLSAKPVADQILDQDHDEPVPQPRQSPRRGKRRARRGLRRAIAGLSTLQKVSAIGLITVAYLLILAIWYIVDTDHVQRHAEISPLINMF